MYTSVRFPLLRFNSVAPKKNEITQYNADTHTSMNTHTQTLPYEHLRKLNWQIFEIDEVTTNASLSTGTSPTTECTTPLNPRIFTIYSFSTIGLIGPRLGLVY